MTIKLFDILGLSDDAVVVHGAGGTTPKKTRGSARRKPKKPKKRSRRTVKPRKPKRRNR